MSSWEGSVHHHDIHDISVYENSEYLRDFLGKHISSLSFTSKSTGVARSKLSDILKGRTKKVRGDTLRRLIRGLKLKVTLVDLPPPMVNEWGKVKIKESFSEAKVKLKKLSAEDRKILIISTYMGETPLLHGDRTSEKCLDFKGSKKGVRDILGAKDKLGKAILLSCQDLEEFFLFMGKSFKTMRFTCAMMSNMHPLLEARRDLAKAFIKVLPEVQIQRFFKTYLSIDEKSRKIIDIFIRNYIRYNKRWAVKLEPPESLKPFLEILKLEATPTSLAFFTLEEDGERNILAEVISNFANLSKTLPEQD
ncbi:MAG: hypothetical protein DDT40_00781 [candidate division WS2 bacterium]|uniref:HTH cro/C1-type domain-containing protein n=1 Tax=Psychracetigena formicireducens TaxID=2986056 RepID=A0A9E2BH88_PSYF1|nr:hypothetical protein [Candidatus Psychracetigena formicireducens]MBT9145531.1 hypothetical protein [Candidatus Psychracetigena formicireducens]MBT9150609.1 hypothetical protein [Candidatus Psychracetigena formicireducens]